MGILFKSVKYLINQKAKVKPFDSKVDDLPLKKNSVVIILLSSSVNNGEEFTNSIT